MESAELAQILGNGNAQSRVVCVTFPVMYRQKRIVTAVLAGPGSKPEGFAELHSVIAELKKSDSVVLYSDCWPMTQCPNIRPAYSAAKQSSLKRVCVLNLPTNLHADWIVKGISCRNVTSERPAT